MAIDIKAKAAELLAKITGDKDLLAKFKKDPLVCVRELLSGIDVPQDALTTITEEIKKAIGGDKTGIIAKIKAFFKKK